MKKKIIATITMLCLLTILYNYLRLPDYHITNSMSFSSADTRDTELTVIVYKCWGIDGVIKDIENEHNKINGTPTTLEINLYYPTYYLHNNSKPFRTTKKYARFLYFLGIPLIAVFPCSYFRKLTFRKDAQCDGS